MRLIIIRHGESEWNRIGRYQGQADVPLSDLGSRQAEALATRLRNEPIHAIFASPLQRASRTAEAVARHHADVPFLVEPALLEIDHGDWQGLMSAEVVEQYGAGLEEWRQYPTRSQMPNGESFSNIESLAMHLELKLNRRVTHAGRAQAAIKNIAWCSGGAQGYFESAIAAGVDAFITGEISEPQAHYAREMGVAFLACGHHASERYGAPAVAAHVAAQLGLAHEFIDIDNPA